MPIMKITSVEVRAHYKAPTINAIIHNQLVESTDTELQAPQVLFSQEEEPAGSVMDMMLTMENSAPENPGSVTGWAELHMAASVAVDLTIMLEAVGVIAEEPEVRVAALFVVAEAEEAIAKHKHVV